MSYMFRAIQLVATGFLVFAQSAYAGSPGGNVTGQIAAGGGRGGDEAACREVEYYKKLNELNAEYKACTERYVEYMNANPQAGSSIAGCGNPSLFQEKADTFSKDLCARICKVYGDPIITDASIKAFTQSGDVEIAVDDDLASGGSGREFIDPNCGKPGHPACPAGPDPDPGRDSKKVPEPDTGGKKPIKDAKATPDGSKPAAERKKPEDGTDPSSTSKKEEETIARTTPQDPGAAQYEAQADIQMANSAFSEGNRCCNSPQSCAGKLPPNDQQNFARMWQQAQQQAPASGQGLSDYCSQMKSATGNGSGLNNYMSTICYSGKNQCEMTCDNLLAKYEALYNNCGGCSSAGIYSSTYTSIRNIRMNCNSLAQKASLLAQQGGANSYSGGYAQACNNFTGNPASMGGLTPEQQKAQDNAANENCLLNTSGPGCKTPELAIKEQKDPTGDAGFGADKKDEKPTFNLQDMRDIPGLDASLGKGVQPQAVSNGTIANNSGGGIPGGGGGSPASLGPNGRSGSPGSPGYDTDVLSANASGASGYSQPGGILPNEPSRDGRWRTMSSGGAENSPLVGMDLKQYLPGGSLDPNRKIAGISPGSQINRKEEDIWRIISNKMYEKCKLGVLWQCGPE